MHASRRNLIGIFAVLIVCAGLVTGVYLSREKTVKPTTAPAPEKTEPNFTTYDISPTSRGAVIMTADVELSIHDDQAVGTLSQKDAAEVKTGQRVLLYNTHGDILGKFGVVESVLLDPTNGRVTITIKPDKDKAVPNDLVTKGKIITGDISDAPRLPLTALIERDGAFYLWEVSSNQDGTSSAYLKEADVTHKTDNFIAINEDQSSSNVFVLNPDDALRDGQTINVKQILYAGPELTEEGRVMVMIKKRQRILVDENTKSLMRMSTPVISKPPPTTINSCNPHAKITTNFIKQIKNISVQEEIKRRAARREARQELMKEKEEYAKPEQLQNGK